MDESGRKTREKLGPRRDALVAAARRSFVARGVAGTSLDDIIAEAGGSRRNIYNLFGGKDGLVDAVVENIIDEAARTAEVPPTPDLPPRDWLISMGQAFSRRMLDPGIIAVLRHFIAKGGASPEAAERLWRIGPARLHRALASWLKIQQAEGRLHIPDIDAAAVLLPTMLRSGFQIEMLMGRKKVVSDEEIRSNVARAVDFFLAATQPRHTPIAPSTPKSHSSRRPTRRGGRA